MKNRRTTRSPRCSINDKIDVSRLRRQLTASSPSAHPHYEIVVGTAKQTYLEARAGRGKVDFSLYLSCSNCSLAK